ncbi:hypothetical protein MUK72_16205 (plasmid) [Halococcus dombrowskii]|uniref:Uncharacterized protein n=1 Tax=Halococcus dombrowskii TaxID=179637 RepID=A0AAV3SDE4_HALDO|nr:hypothetical protein [Halococcus dombrowskii]UOO96718.1 hypothetical protein MUK72_16205 [Halococcus dombrowskii]
MITTADITLGTRFEGSVDVPLETTYITNDLQLALGRIRGTAIIDTAYTDRIDEDKHWQYQFLVDATNQRVVLERLELFDGADSGAFTDREVLDTEGVKRGVVVEEYERTLAQLLRRTTETDSGGLTTTRGDGILSAVYAKYAEYPDAEFANTDAVPFDSYDDVERHFIQDEVRQLWRTLTDIDQIGSARATNLILTSRATDLTDLRDHLEDEQWEYISSELAIDP